MSEDKRAAQATRRIIDFLDEDPNNTFTIFDPKHPERPPVATYRCGWRWDPTEEVS